MPEPIVSFIRVHVPSVWALEQLLLMRRTADRTWSAAELEREMRANVALVTANLALFERTGLVLKDESGRYAFAAATEAQAQICGELAELYRERPVAVINIIAARASPIQQLADAFKIKREDK